MCNDALMINPNVMSLFFNGIIITRGLMRHMVRRLYVGRKYELRVKR
jgi:hypothetical protein